MASSGSSSPTPSSSVSRRPSTSTSSTLRTSFSTTLWWFPLLVSPSFSKSQNRLSTLPWSDVWGDTCTQIKESCSPDILWFFISFPRCSASSLHCIGTWSWWRQVPFSEQYFWCATTLLNCNRKLISYSW